MKRVLTLLVFASVTSLMASDIAAVAQKCATCHGKMGEKKALMKSKIIKDMSKADFISAMKGYKDGSYGGPMKGVMKPQVMTLNDGQMSTLADLYIK